MGKGAPTNFEGEGVLPGAYRLILFFEWACHIKNVDILGGTPTWDLDVPVHGTVANHAGWPSELFT